MKLNLIAAGIVVMLALAILTPAYASSTRPVLALMDFKVVPSATVSATATSSPLMSGDSGTVVVTITNTLKSPGTGNTTVHSDQVSSTYYTGSVAHVDMTQTTSDQKTSSDAPSGSAAIRFVNLIADGPIRVLNGPYTDTGSLGMGDTARFEFTIKADSGAADGKYYLQLRVKTDDDAVFLNQVIPVVVDNTGVKMVLNDAPTTLGTGKNNIVIDVVNYRPNGVTSASVIPSGDQFQFKPRQEYTVGSIGTGEMYTVTFDTAIKNGTYDTNPSFVVKYKNGDNWHESQPLTVHLEPKTVAVAASSGDNGSLVYLVGGLVLLVVLVGAVFLFMRSQRAKK